MIKLFYFLSFCYVVFCCIVPKNPKNDCTQGKYISTCCPDNTVAICYCNSQQVTYSIVSEKVNFKTAFTTCKRFGMDMVSVKSKKEENYIINHMMAMTNNCTVYNNDRFWISGIRITGKSGFYWMNNGQPVKYQNFLPGEQKNSVRNEGCLVMTYRDKQLSWSDSDCGDNYKYICQTRKGCF